jgi:hypothetical protein
MQEAIMDHRKTSKLKIVGLTILIFLMGCSTPTAQPTPLTSPAHPILIDTDMAPDDWMAILYLLQRSDVTVKAITVTGAGETHCDPGIRHAMGLVALAGYDDVPITCEEYLRPCNGGAGK